MSDIEKARRLIKEAINVDLDFNKINEAMRIIQACEPRDEKICWCRDCVSYCKIFERVVCTNKKSEWYGDYPNECCSCRYCIRKKE